MKIAKVASHWLAKLGVIAALMTGTGSLAVAGTIVGTDHDFSTSGFSGGQICVVCHAPHNNAATVTDAPLWNHALTSKTFTLYSSPTLDATTAQPGGVSKLCLSCHDGTVAIDSFGGATGTNFMSGDHAVGAAPSDLTNDHPISITYNTALATTDGALFDPSAKTVTIGTAPQSKTGTIEAVMLYSGQIQCATCHDVHNAFAVSGTNGEPLLRVSKASSAICLTCHNK